MISGLLEIKAAYLQEATYDLPGWQGLSPGNAGLRL